MKNYSSLTTETKVCCCVFA